MNLNKIKINIFTIYGYIGGFIIIFQVVNSFPQNYLKNTEAVIDNNTERIVA